MRIHTVTSVQNEFSLLYRGDAGELLPWLRDQGIGYLAYSPLAAGRLTGAIRAGHRFGPDDWRSGAGRFADWRTDGEEWPFDPDALERDLEVVERLRVRADLVGATVAQLALRWAIDQPGVTAVIAGSRDPAHTRGNAGAGSIALDRETAAGFEAA